MRTLGVVSSFDVNDTDPDNIYRTWHFRDTDIPLKDDASDFYYTRTDGPTLAWINANLDHIGKGGN